MRGLIPGLPTPHPFGPALPALFQQDDMAQRLLSALDEVLAPVFCTLDSLDAYFDPSLAPDDFVEWLAGWVGLSLDENWSFERRRAVLAQTATLFPWRGTARAMAGHVALSTGVEPEVVESGAIAWSPTPNSPLPGRAHREVTVRLRVPKGSVTRAHVEAIVAAAKPAHVAHRVEVSSG